MLSTQLRTFYAVAREGSFTAAADALHISQPTLSSQIQNLEALYGVELFRRHGRGVELTETGKQLMEIAHRIVSNQEEAITFLKAVNGLEAGRLRIGAVGSYQAAEILAAFHQDYPGIHVSLNFGNSSEILNDVIDYRVDIGIIGRQTDDAALYTMHYSDPQPIIIVPKSHRWSAQNSIKLSELAGEEMIRREYGSLTRHAFESALAREKITVNYVMEISSKDGVIAAVAQNIGIGVISEEEHIPEQYICPLQISDITLRMQVIIVCRAERRKSHLIKPFFDVATSLINR
ncbi:MAG: LysR family transcriptional regulator [Magnetovibrio sp.]|nr:LysR family transcriptional regulator [Magnetovibrio sp.]|tara:strand:+ start:2324 stop:3193 length:870 start_codon:yes stop_codon:yes gene_type:complete